MQAAMQRNSHICHQNGFDIVPSKGEGVVLRMKVDGDDEDATEYKEEDPNEDLPRFQ